ncbi:Uncharacterized protein Adt_16232 [Abeliophyllum distichum]|uniref:Uncharacterized protein n=1 Tax=Abeliophyllum distichum TaxID=126358 RepID=A0ABD1TD33_9LAMI
MAPNQNKNSEGVCEKIYNALSGGRKICLISHHVQGSVSGKSVPKSQVQATDNPAKASLSENKPVFLNQPSHRMIPIEFEPSIRPSPMTQKENMKPAAKNAGKEDGTKRVSEISVQEIVINGECHGPNGKVEAKTHGQVDKVASMKDKPHVSMEEKPKLKGRMASMGTTKATEDQVIQEKGDKDNNTALKSANDMFSDYIDHVKNKMGTVPNLGGGGPGGGGRTDTRRDSFDDN